MRKTLVLLTISTIGLLISCNQNTKKNKQNEQKVVKTDNSILGKWIRIGQTGAICFDFKENGIVEVDFDNDNSVDILSEYNIQNDTIIFEDKEGKMCQEVGSYTIDKTDYYLAFNLVEDNCNGRIKTTMGFWTKPNYKELLKNLDKKISDTTNKNLYLNRARIFMAIGELPKAKLDLDVYIKNDSSNARAYINRAATKFPNDMKGVVLDCNKAISIDSTIKNSYFLRAIALYELGKKEKACEDFNKAIELGFSILRSAEQEKCAEFWEENK